MFDEINADLNTSHRDWRTWSLYGNCYGSKPDERPQSPSRAPALCGLTEVLEKLLHRCSGLVSTPPGSLCSDWECGMNLQTQSVNCNPWSSNINAWHYLSSIIFQSLRLKLVLRGTKWKVVTDMSYTALAVSPSHIFFHLPWLTWYRKCENGDKLSLRLCLAGKQLFMEMLHKLLSAPSSPPLHYGDTH